MRDVTAPFSAIERESTKMHLEVNGGKTKYMLSTSEVMPRMVSQITANGYNFDVVKEFVTLAPPLTQITTSAWKSGTE